MKRRRRKSRERKNGNLNGIRRSLFLFQKREAIKKKT